MVLITQRSILKLDCKMSKNCSEFDTVQSHDKTTTKKISITKKKMDYRIRSNNYTYKHAAIDRL